MKFFSILFMIGFALHPPSYTTKIVQNNLSPSTEFKYSQRFLKIFEAYDDFLHDETRDPWQQRHLEQHRKIVLEAASQVKNKKRALIMGAGNGSELPMADLAQMFDEVVLIGLSEKALKRAKEKVNPEDRHKIKTRIADVTNDVAAQTIDHAQTVVKKESSRAYAKQKIFRGIRSKKPFQPFIVDQEGFDFVISPMIIHQLQSIVYREIESLLKKMIEPRNTERQTDNYYDDITLAFWEQHIRSLLANLKPGGISFVSGNISKRKTILDESGDYTIHPGYSKPFKPELAKAIKQIIDVPKEVLWFWHTYPPTETKMGDAFIVKSFIFRKKEAPLRTVDNSI